MAPKRPFQSDAALTAIAIGYKNPEASRIADEVMPRHSVPTEKFGWTEYPAEDAFNVPDARVGRKGRVKQLEFGGEQKTSEVEDYGLDAPVPTSDINSAAAARKAGLSKHDPEGHAVEMISETIENIREVRVARTVHNADNYSAGRKVTLSGSDQFSDYAGADPIGVIKTGLENVFIMPANTMVIGRKVWTALSSNPKIVNAVKGNLTSEGIVTRQQFLELFSGEGIKRLLIGDAFFNAAKPGQAANLQRAWGNHISLLHINRKVTTQGGGVTWGLTAEFGGKIAGRIEDPDIGLEGGYRIRRGERVKELVVAKDVGYFIQNAVAG
ncbi:capsid protein [Pseudophaeobacter sp.]|uniref:capsid protein n=1 Tax=Pseudophaeobacter sp. TaxID=1971739 RepID=UPI00329A5766